MCNMNGLAKQKLIFFGLRQGVTDARYFVITVWLYIQEHMLVYMLKVLAL